MFSAALIKINITLKTFKHDVKRNYSKGTKDMKLLV